MNNGHATLLRGQEFLDERIAKLNGSNWPAPINLLRDVGAPPLTRDDVPRVIGDFAGTLATAGGFDATGIILSATVCAAAAIDDRIRLLLPGASSHFESGRLWSAAIAPPGAGKSPMQKAALAPIFELHRDLISESQRQRDAKEDDAERVPHRALFTSDCTVDKLAEILADNPNGILYC